jgi:hypothetical protein
VIAPNVQKLVQVLLSSTAILLLKKLAEKQTRPFLAGKNVFVKSKSLPHRPYPRINALMAALALVLIISGFLLHRLWKKAIYALGKKNALAAELAGRPDVFATPQAENVNLNSREVRLALMAFNAKKILAVM